MSAIDVLRELVALQDLEAALPVWPFHPDPDAEQRADLERRTPIAWANARAALAAHEAQQPYGWVPMYREGEESARIFFKKPTGDLLDCCRPVYTRGTK